LDRKNIARREGGYEPLEKRREYAKRYLEKNRERINALSRLRKHQRRARKNKAKGTVSPNIVEVLLLRQKGLCACCGVELNGVWHLDHIMPLALGGAHDDANLQLLTPTCNRSKGALHPDEYMRRKQIEKEKAL
jgi:5-methylcytosine-specific restriction endonuclease McrA